MRALGWCLLVVLLSPLASASELSTRLDQAIQAIPGGGLSGIAVYDMSLGKWLYLTSSNQPMSLASTTKLLTTVATYHYLGAGYEFSTKVLSLGPLQAGAIPGLAVIGGGDPCLDEHFYSPQPEAVFEEWAAQLRRFGINRIAGDIVIDDTLFAGPIRPSTYPQDADNQQHWFSAPASAFAWNDNCIEVHVVPSVPGHPGDVEVRPVSDLIQIRNLTRTVGSENRTAITRDLDQNAITVSGSIGKTNSAWFPLAIAENPELLAGEELKHVLERSGIAVTGAVRLAPVPTQGLPLLIDQRHSLQDALILMNHDSQNFYAEQMLRMVGATHGGEGSITAGRAAVIAALGDLLGKDALESVMVLDGSGLSYGNHASASFMVKLLIAVQQTPIAEAFMQTLKSRDAGKAHGFVKTGTHAAACCLVGYIDLPNHHRLAFASLLNPGQSTSFEEWRGRTRETLFKIICESAER